MEGVYTADELAHEEWRPAPGFEADYSVSNLGRVRRDTDAPFRPRIAGGILRPTWRGRYLGVSMRATRPDGSRYQITASVHRLVAAAFLGDASGRQVNHRSGDRSNNRATNLEYCTQVENMQHASRLGLTARGERHGSRTQPERVPRGERSGSRTRPDRRPRGEAHWTRREPEAILKGERNANAKMTPDDVKEIRRRYANGETQESLGNEYGVQHSTIGRIVRRAAWSHIE